MHVVFLFFSSAAGRAICFFSTGADVVAGRPARAAAGRPAGPPRFVCCVTAVWLPVWWLKPVLFYIRFPEQVSEYSRVADAMTSVWSRMFEPVRSVTVCVLSRSERRQHTHRGSGKWPSGATSAKIHTFNCTTANNNNNNNLHTWQINNHLTVVGVCGGCLCLWAVSNSSVSLTFDLSFETSCQISYSIR